MSLAQDAVMSTSMQFLFPYMECRVGLTSSEIYSFTIYAHWIVTSKTTSPKTFIKWANYFFL